MAMIAGLFALLHGPSPQAALPGDAARFALATLTLAVTGAAFGPLLVRRGAIAAPFVGWLWAGIAFVALILVVGSSTVVDFVLRNGLIPDLVGQFAFALVGIVWGGVILLPAIVVSGLVWAILTRSLNRLLEPSDALARLTRLSAGIPFGLGAVALLGTAILTAALVQATVGRPANTRCLDVGGEMPLAGAWSPDGNKIVIASTSDPNRMGHVRLFEWSSGELIGQWPAWVEDRQTVVVENDGRVIWTSTEMQPPWSDTLMSATPTESPRVFAVPAHPWDMSLVDSEIRAKTADGSHRPIRIPLSGPEIGRALPLEFPIRQIGTMWWSPDGRWAAAIEEWATSPAVLVQPDGTVREVAIGEDSYPRTFALTPDRSALITARWVGHSTLTDVDSDTSRPILDGRQRWIVVSERADVAWARDDGMPSRPCIAPLSGL